MKTASATVSKTLWADVVKGPTQKKNKFNAASPEFVPRKKAEQKFNFNAEAPEFLVPEPTMNASAPEFVPPVSSNLNASTSEFIPPQHKLLNKAAEMQKMLLECYTDDESSDSDEEKLRSTMQKRKQLAKNSNIAILPF